MPDATPRDRAGFRRIVLSIAVAETVVWAALYYSFPALLLEWERDLGWSKTELSGAFTLALIVSAVLAPVVGRLIDRNLGRYAFTGSAVLGGVLIASLALVESLWAFYLVWAAIGACMAGCLYEPCFALLTRTFGGQAKRAITWVTLVAGFASTVCFPSAHALVELVGWRGTVVVFGVVTLMVGAPLMWWSCRAAEASRAAASEGSPAEIKPFRSRALARSWPFWLLAVAFVSLSLNHAMLISHLLPILDSRELSPELAILAASGIGPMQVAGRLLMMAGERRFSLSAIGLGCFVAIAMASGCLLVGRMDIAFVAAFVVLQGMGVGITSIVRPLIVAALLGRRDFGVISGMLATLTIAATAAAPTLAALIWGVRGYDAVILLAAMLATVGAFGLAAAGWSARRAPPPL